LKKKGHENPTGTVTWKMMQTGISGEPANTGIDEKKLINLNHNKILCTGEGFITGIFQI
jgi:hypothetical protein